jgi:hypothetical protein
MRRFYLGLGQLGENICEQICIGVLAIFNKPSSGSVTAAEA